MAVPAPEHNPVPDATLLPGSGSGSGDGHDVTQVPAVNQPPSQLLLAALNKADTGVPGYELLEELGRGGMGVVYKARQRALNRLVALKMVLAGVHAGSADLARFRSEAEVVAQLQHPNIVQIYEIGEQHGRPYLALELVAGGTLSRAIAGTPQPTRASAYLVELLARAIHFAHQRGVIHRDLKPGNVLLAVPLDGATAVTDKDGAQLAALYGIPKVTDFGLAKRMEDDAQHTRSGDILGTPSYMAPEQAGGQASNVGPQADVYALGAILYELLTGRAPFKGATSFETIQQVLHEDPVPPGRLRSRLPKDLERICLKCLEKDPRRRYSSALELAADLRRHLNGESVHARSAPFMERLWRWARRNPVPAGLLLALTLGTVVGFWLLSNLSQSLVRSAALEGAVQQTETMDEANKYFSRVAAHLTAAGVQGDSDWESKPGELTMPPPATMTIDLGQHISNRSESGMQVRLYSDYPFTNRMNRPPPDDFEREALAELQRDPSKPYYRFVELDGRPVLRFASARVMEQGCINCHTRHPNRHPNNPAWKVGDVRGVLEIIRPLDRDQDRINRGLRNAVLIVSGSGFSLLSLSVFLIYLGNRRHRPAAQRSSPSDSSAIPHTASTAADRPPLAPVTPGVAEMPVLPPPAASLTIPPDAQASAVNANEVAVPDEVVVLWRVTRPIGTLTPVRLTIPAEGTLRLTLSEGEIPVELRVEVNGEATTSGFGIIPCVDVAVRVGSVVSVRLRAAEMLDSQYTLSAELLTVQRGTAG